MSAQTGVRTRAGAAAASAVTWSLVALAILIAALIRLRLLNVPFERDEGEYAYAGQLILSGVPPYTHLYNMKLPGTYLIYALSMRLFGQTIAGARLGLVLATSATAVGVFLLARRFFAARHAAGGAAAYATLALSTELLGPFGHATHFVALFAVWGFVALAGTLEKGGSFRYFTAGLLMGTAFLMKQPGAVFVACGAVWVVAARLPGRWRSVGAFLLGAATPLGLLIAWLASTGTLAQFWLWVVRYGGAYGASMSLSDGIGNLWLAASRFLPQAALLWLLAAGGAGLLSWRGITGQTRFRVASLLVFSFLGVCPGLYFREHYFLLLLPAVAILIGLASSRIDSLPRVPRWVAPALVALACFQALYAQREILIRARPEEVARRVYGPDLFAESVPIGMHLRERTRPGDSIVVFGSEPQILFYARRRSATGFIYMYPLMERQPWARAMQERMIQEVEESRPAYAVLIKTPTSWLERPDSEHRLQDWATPYLAANYAVEGQVILTDQGTRYLWDTAAAGAPIGEATQALVMRRRDFVRDR